MDAASGEGDAGARLDAKQLRKIVETGNHCFLFCLCSSLYFILHMPVCVCVCVCVHQLTLKLKIRNFIYGLDFSSEKLMFYGLKMTPYIYGRPLRKIFMEIPKTLEFW